MVGGASACSYALTRRHRLLLAAGLADASAALLALADDNGLSHLRAVALDFVVHNYETVSKTGEA